MPNSRTDPSVLLCTGILRHEGVYVDSCSDEDGHQGETDHACRCGCGNGFRRVPGEEHPIDKMLNGYRACAQEEGEGEVEDLSVAAVPLPSIFYRFNHLAPNIQHNGLETNRNLIKRS